MIEDYGHFAEGSSGSGEQCKSPQWPPGGMPDHILPEID
jgi:hypothetical protein